ncbi:MAG: ribulose-phosphate 3-epimerase [Treponema sp.]|nr:ribulose-phosphate 3-epimerase [Treponema sp.]
MENRILAPSLLSADFSNLGAAVKLIEEKNGGAVHIDVMDGKFVPEISYGQPVVKSLRPCTKLPFDVHLMVDQAAQQIESFAKQGADWITFHIENSPDAQQIIDHIHSLGKKAGISIKPKTPVSAIEHLLKKVDIVLVMTVEPGFGGQALIPECLDKVTQLCALRENLGADYKISVDGGINEKTIDAAIKAGSDILVSGSAFFSGRLVWE